MTFSAVQDPTTTALLCPQLHPSRAEPSWAFSPTQLPSQIHFCLGAGVSSLLVTWGSNPGDKVFFKVFLN